MQRFFLHRVHCGLLTVIRENISDVESSLLSLLHVEYDTVFLEKSLAGTQVRARTAPISWPVSTVTLVYIIYYIDRNDRSIVLRFFKILSAKFTLMKAAINWILTQ